MSAESSTISAPEPESLASLSPNVEPVPATSPQPAVAASADGLTVLVTGDADGLVPARADSRVVSDGTPEQTLEASEDLLARLGRLFDSVVQVEELSRQAREAAATDLARYDELLATEGRFATGLAEATRLREQAGAMLARAFGSAARAMASPTLAEAESVEDALARLTAHWRQAAEAFLGEHPDVETLLAERRAQAAEAQEREAAAARAQRLEQLLAGTDGALRLGHLDEAQQVLRRLSSEFGDEEPRVMALRGRLEQRRQAARDADARAAMAEADQHQARGDPEAAVRVLEKAEARGLSREVSQDLFGAWSVACSRLAQTAGLDLVRFAPAQGRGMILARDPDVPFGLVVFSSLGLGPNYPEGRIVTDPLIITRARPFRPAEPLPETGGWAARSSYVAPASTAVPDEIVH